MSKDIEFPVETRLEGFSERYFCIPAQIILNKEQHEKRVSIFSYISVFRGLDNSLKLDINDIVKWFGRNPDNHGDGINKKVEKIIDYLKSERIIVSASNSGLAHASEVFLNLDEITRLCEYNRFAMIYVDEFRKIVQYCISNKKDGRYTNCDVVLLVFSYLRMVIYRRRNKLMPEEINLDNKNDHEYDIRSRRLRCPEAYDCYYYEIADRLGLTERAVSKAVKVLEELDLIYSQALPRIKDADDNWRTTHTIFCNTEKREGSHLLAVGMDYYTREIENKINKLGKYRKRV